MEQLIREIADLIDAGEVVFLHKKTYDLLHYPVSDGIVDPEFDYIAEEVLDIVLMAPDQYTRFDPLHSNESYEIMEAFVDTLTYTRQKERLWDALSSKMPFRNFRQVVQTLNVEQEWFAYKNASLDMYVRDRI